MLLTVDSVGRVLDAYTAEHPERGVSELATLLGVSKSKAHALASSMAQIGLLRRVEGGRYRLGWRPLELTRLITETTPFRPHARAAAAAIARRSGEAVHVATLDAGRVVYVDKLRGARAVHIAVSKVGGTLPAHCSGVGKALLAHLPPEQIDAVLDAHGLEAMTPHTITDRELLYAELHHVRRDRLAYDREEVMTGLACVAAPILDDDGNAVAALSISAPVDRFAANESVYASTVARAARIVSERMAVPDTQTLVESLKPAEV